MTIPGYHDATYARSPVSLDELAQIQRSALFDAGDVALLRRSYDILKDQVEAILDVWYGFVGANPHLLASFSHRAEGTPLADYLGRVRARFGQWILDTARAEHDQRWLDYQHEIGLRHHRSKKNTVDGATAAPAIVPFRDLFALIFPVTFTLKPFLAARGATAEEVDRMYAAWLKSCLIQLTLWSHPYITAGDF